MTRISIGIESNPKAETVHRVKPTTNGLTKIDEYLKKNRTELQGVRYVLSIIVGVPR